MKDKVWVSVVSAFLVIAMITGGSSLPDRNLFLALSALSIAMLSLSLWRLRGVVLEPLTAKALVIMAAGLAFMFIQLVPLPQLIWSALGSRAFVADGLAATQQAGAWLPMTLSPEATRQDILAVLPGIAAFVAIISVSLDTKVVIVFTVIAMAALQVLMAAAQATASIVIGSFVNPNFFAAMIYMAIPFVVYAASRNKQKAIWVLAGIGILLGIVAIGQSGSRIGLVLGLATALLGVSTSRFASRNLASYALIITAAITVAILMFGGAGLERFAGLQAAVALRADLLNTSLQAVISFLPAGSGFGSFVPVYQMFEAPNTVTPAYINHAHNDWLELVLEGGLFAVALIGAFLFWFAGAVRATWNNNFALGKAAAISSSAVLLHSLADYPLRTPALLVLFAVCCGLMTKASFAHKRNSHGDAVWRFEPEFSRAGALS